MSPHRAWTLSILLATTALAGCFGGDELPTAYDVSASGGIASEGWAYNGTGLVDATANMEGSVDVAADTGVLNLTFEAWNSTWTVTHDSFSGQEDHMDGGIAQELTAHGDTGVASTAIPQVRLDLATWGSAEVLRDGEPYSIGNGSGGAWFAHLMLSKDTVRGSDGMIAKENATGPYDPSQPTNARIIEDDPQGILELIAPSGADATRSPATVSESFSFGPGTSPQADVPLPTSAYSTATVQVSTSGTQGLQAGNITVRIVDANGTALEEDEAQISPDSPYNATFELSDLSGETTVQIRGMGSYEASVDAQVVYDDHAFIVITWDDYTLEPR